MKRWWRKWSDMADYITVERFDGAVATIREDLRGILGDMRSEFRHRDERLEKIETKVEAIIEIVPKNTELLQLTPELRDRVERLERRCI